jgi:hypothetical protein
MSMAGIVQIEQTPSAGLTRHVKAAFEAARLGESWIDPAVLEIDGMSGRKYRQFINNLIRGLPDPRYLEIGSWKGSTLCAAINRNRVHALAIDNWSQFDGPRVEFHANLARFVTPQVAVAVVESDFRQVAFAGLGRFNVYLFDGPHEYQDQFDAIRLARPALDPEFVLIVDDWNWQAVREGTLRALAACGMDVTFSLEIRTSLDGSHGEPWGQHGDWHNGYFIAVVTAPPP